VGIFSRTSRISRILIVGVLAILVSGAVSNAPATALFASQFGHPAGCHQHAKTDRLPAPVNHQCCATGHQAAIPANAFAGPQLPCFHGIGESPSLKLHPSLPSRLTSLSFSSESPIFNPLRI
jgi:hypothetical protein